MSGQESSGKPISVGIVVWDGADPMDVVGPYRVFIAAGAIGRFIEGSPEWSVHLVAETLDTQDWVGLRVAPTTTYEQCPSLDVLLVSGGDAETPDRARQLHQRHEPTLSFVRTRSVEADITASVCTGAFVLAGAGLLAGRRANTHWANRQELRDLMGERGESLEIVEERVVDDGDLITAGGVTSGIDLGLAIVERLAGAELRGACEGVLERETPASV
ncbi:MAG: DJ-1/PfpI family protein [Solirubrobacterales bacterium]